MQTVNYKGLSFVLPDGDRTFATKLSNYVDEIPGVLPILPKRPSGTLVVVGGCFGATAVAGVTLGGMGWAVVFEPDPRNLRLLAANLERNGVADRVKVIPKAAGAATGRAQITFCSDKNIGGNIVHQGQSSLPTQGLDWVDVVSVDDTLKELGVSDIGLVWCDAQGNEPYVMAGASSLLTGAVPWGIELAPGLMSKLDPAEYCYPLQCVFTNFYDLRFRHMWEVSQLPTLYRKYAESRSPNNPAKVWHTQLLAFRKDSRDKAADDAARPEPRAT